MLKHHKIIAFCISLTFLIVVQKFATPEPIFRFLLPIFLAYVGAVTLYNNWYLKQTQKYNFWALLMPELLLAAAFGVFLIIPSENFRGLFLILTVLITAFYEIILGNFSESIVLSEILIIAFGLFLIFFASYYYAPVYQPLYLTGIFVGSALLARAFYELVPKSGKTKMVAAITLGLFCAELYWVLNFLHFHYSVLSLLLFNLFYFCLILNYYHSFQNLNMKKVQFHLLLIGLCSVAVLLATPWKIVN